MGADFAQNAALLAVAFISAFIGIFKYLKTEAGKGTTKTSTSDVGTVMTASFIDSRVLRELIDTMKVGTEEYARESRKLIRSRQELITALEETTDAVLANTDASVNLLRFMRREGFKGDDSVGS